MNYNDSKLWLEDKCSVLFQLIDGDGIVMIVVVIAMMIVMMTTVMGMMKSMMKDTKVFKNSTDLVLC